LEFTAIKGFKDVLPGAVENWQVLEGTARDLLEAFGFTEIRTPILEWTELFSRGIGQETDIVSKEMYTFNDPKGKGMTMRPEATASVVRAYIQHSLHRSDSVQKLYSIGPMFRHERPQKGRFRQFHQINAEAFGDRGPMSDAEVIALAVALFESLRLDDTTLHLNSLGCPECRPGFKGALQDHLSRIRNNLCTDCQRRSELNPLRVFDCKIEDCRKAIEAAPSILHFLCPNCMAHFESVKNYLAQLDIKFILDHHLVRGLDYYTKTTFEIQASQLGSQNAIAGGGRYDGLVKLLGGPDHPAVGFAVGMERVIALIEKRGKDTTRPTDLFLAPLGDRAHSLAFSWAATLRKTGMRVKMDYEPKGLKALMKRADRVKASWVLIVGDNELRSGTGTLRNMHTREQTEVELDDLVSTLTRLVSPSA
jgi:histidyl-tRNA synthetase